KPHESELEIVAMYLAQTPSTDIGREQAASHGIPIKPTVSDAIVPGIQGVALVGEHGDYPLNEKGQKLYPRYETDGTDRQRVSPDRPRFTDVRGQAFFHRVA